MGDDEDEQQVVAAEDAAPGAAEFLESEAIEDAPKEGAHSSEDASADLGQEDKKEEKPD